MPRARRGSSITADQAEQWLIEALREWASEDPAVKLAAEPINGYESDLIHTVGSAQNLVKQWPMSWNKSTTGASSLLRFYPFLTSRTPRQTPSRISARSRQK
jgi:hypothetical protein